MLRPIEKLGHLSKKNFYRILKIKILRLLSWFYILFFEDFLSWSEGGKFSADKNLIRGPYKTALTAAPAAIAARRVDWKIEKIYYTLRVKNLPQ